MNDDFQRLRTGLTDLADAAAPPSPFDPVRTAASGRRRMLATRTSAIGGTGALAAAAVFAIVAAFGPGGTSAPATPMAGTGIGADPMSKDLDFGWLPPALPNVSYVAMTISQGDDVVAQGNKVPGGAPRVDMQLLPTHGPGMTTSNQRLIPVKLNDGRQAYWVTQSTGGGLMGEFELRFPAKDGRWVLMSWSVNWGGPGDVARVGGLSTSTTTEWPDVKTPPTSPPVSAQWQEWLLHIATDVTDTPTAIPMPLRVTGLPPGFRPDRTLLWRPGESGAGAPGTFSASLGFDDGDASASIDVGPHGTLLEAKSKGAQCKTSGGLDVCVNSSGDFQAYKELGGAEGLLDRITLLGTDEKQWTTEVFVP